MLAGGEGNPIAVASDTPPSQPPFATDPLLPPPQVPYQQQGPVPGPFEAKDLSMPPIPVHATGTNPSTPPSVTPSINPSANPPEKTPLAPPLAPPSSAPPSSGPPLAEGGPLAGLRPGSGEAVTGGKAGGGVSPVGAPGVVSGGPETAPGEALKGTDAHQVEDGSQKPEASKAAAEAPKESTEKLLPAGIYSRSNCSLKQNCAANLCCKLVLQSCGVFEAREHHLSRGRSSAAQVGGVSVNRVSTPHCDGL